MLLHWMKGIIHSMAWESIHLSPQTIKALSFRDVLNLLPVQAILELPNLVHLLLDNLAVPSLRYTTFCIL